MTSVNAELYHREHDRKNEEHDRMMRMRETIEWHECATRMPDDDTSVLIFGAGADPVCEGFLEGGRWHLANGVPIVGEITHWADMPYGPSAKE